MNARWLLLASLLASTAHADEACRFERIVLFRADAPKATLIKRPFVITTAPKPKARRVKHFDAPRRDGYNWVCDDIEPIADVPFERVALLDAPEAASEESFGALAGLPTDPTSAGVTATEDAAFAWAAPAIVAYGPAIYLPVAAVAEPQSYALILLGLAAVAVWRRHA